MDVQAEVYLCSSISKVAEEQSAKASSRLKSCIRDQVISVFCLLQSTECHLGSRDVFLRVLKIFKLKLGQSRETSFCRRPYQRVFLPRYSLMLVGIRVGKAFNLTSLAPKESMEVRADFVALALFQVVTLRASCLSAS